LGYLLPGGARPSVRHQVALADLQFREACVRCSLLRPDPAQRSRLTDIRDNLIARIDEAEREGWLGEVEGLQVSLAGAEEKLAHLDRLPTSRSVVDLGLPTITDTGSTTQQPPPTAAE